MILQTGLRTLVHLEGQNKVRTFFEEGIEIPIYGIPVSERRVR